MPKRFPVVADGDASHVLASIQVTDDLRREYELGAEFCIDPMLLGEAGGRRLIGFSITAVQARDSSAAPDRCAICHRPFTSEAPPTGGVYWHDRDRCGA